MKHGCARTHTVGFILACFNEIVIVSRICLLMKHRNRHISFFSKKMFIYCLSWVLVVALRIFLYHIHVKINR